MKKASTILFVMAFFMLLTSCSATKNASGKVYKKKVEVSYYADKFNGNKTASGEKFSNNNLTAAHRTLAFGTKLRITNVANGKSVIVKVNDRGPQKKSRELDISKRAFMEITDNKNHGILTISIEIVN